MEITRTADHDTTTWTLTLNGTQVATLAVWTVNGEISSVETLAAYQGNGYATALYRHADADFNGIFHTIPAHRSDDGNAFAARVGGYDIGQDDALVIDCCCCDHCDPAAADTDGDEYAAA